MKLKMIVLIILFSTNAHAGFPADALGKVADVMSDVVTGGQHGRDRDKNRAEQAKAAAQEKQRQARLAIQNDINSRKAVLNEMLKRRDLLEDVFQRTSAYLEKSQKQGELLKVFIIEYRKGVLSKEALASLISMQLSDLNAWATDLSKVEPNQTKNPKIFDLKEKVEEYRQLISNMPVESQNLSADDLLNLIYTSKELEMSLVMVIDETDVQLEKLQQEIEKQEQAIKSNEEKLK